MSPPERTPCSPSMAPAGTRKAISCASPTTSLSCTCRPTAPNSIPSRMSGPTCAATNSATASSKPTRISSMPAAMHGVGSLLSPTTSLQSEHVFGHVSVNDTGRMRTSYWRRATCSARRRRPGGSYASTWRSAPIRASSNFFAVPYRVSGDLDGRARSRPGRKAAVTGREQTDRFPANQAKKRSAQNRPKLLLARSWSPLH